MCYSRYLSEKSNPWIYRGYYHPAWFKREQDSATPNKVGLSIHIFAEAEEEL